jgi:hypothetical protein
MNATSTSKGKKKSVLGDDKDRSTTRNEDIEELFESKKGKGK